MMGSRDRLPSYIRKNLDVGETDPLAMFQKAEMIQKVEYTNRDGALGEQMAANESENFTVYSDIQFLYLIGKACAQGKIMHEDGL